MTGRWLLAGLAVLLIMCCVLAAGIGAVSIPPDAVVGCLVRRLGLGGGSETAHDQVLWAIRFPRVALAALVGASLAAAGAAMQGVFGNPLAEPGIVGVSSGAALGAVGSIVLRITTFGQWSVTVAAFLGGLVTTIVVYLLARSGGRTEVVTLTLTGVAVTAVAGAGIGMFTFVASDAQLRDITFWTLGSLGGSTWTLVLAVLPFALAGMIILPCFARALDLLALGERGARHVGVETEWIRAGVIAAVALLTAAAVAAAGIVGFVGLLVPHVIRLVGGPPHRVLIPASALAGATVLVLADLAARTIAVPAEVPLGVLTALIGGPFFLWLLRRTRSEHGGWA